jgi:RNA polymerase sigma-70 factor (sigma-E family)
MDSTASKAASTVIGYVREQDITTGSPMVADRTERSRAHDFQRVTQQIATLVSVTCILGEFGAWRGGPVTFEQFAAVQTRGLLGLAIAMSADRHLAEDLVQDVLLKVHQRWARIESLDDPPSYVRRMLTNEFLSWRRKWARVTPSELVDVHENPGDGPDPATTHADRDAISRQLQRLPRRQRAVLALRFYAGLDDREIAAALGCSASSVRSHASRAIAALRVNARDLLTSTEERS